MEVKTNIEALLEQSKGTDIAILLRAKEQAKRLVNDDARHLPILKTASSMLEEAMEAQKSFTDVKTVLEYLRRECGRKVGQAKLYKDINSGRLKRDKGGNFTRRAVDNYATSLTPLTGLTARNVDKAEAISLRRQEASTRREEENARMLKRRREILEGKYLEKEQVLQTLAARAAALKQGLVAMLEAEAPEMVELVTGDQARAGLLAPWLEEKIDSYLSDYCAVDEFSVKLDLTGLADDPERGGDGELDDDDLEAKEHERE